MACWGAQTIPWLTLPTLTGPWTWTHSLALHSRFEQSRNLVRTVEDNVKTTDDKAVATAKTSATTEETTTAVDNADPTDGRGVVKTKASATIEETTTVVVDNAETTEEATTAEDKVETTDDKRGVISEISETIVEGIANPV